VSRSLLERRALGIFPGRIWLYAGSTLVAPDVAPAVTSALTSASNAQADAADAAGALLARSAGGRWWRPALDVTVSDERARVVLLPWQDGLRTPAQQLRYAEACLEDAGASASGGWTMQYCYRRHAHAGVAYALPTADLEHLTAQASENRLRLRSVLPVSAAAYWRHPLPRRRGSGASSSLLLLGEAHRYTLLRLEGPVLMALDVQPAAADREQALRRLLRRAQVTMPSAGEVGFWSYDSSDVPDQIITGCFATASIRTLPHRSWE